MGKILCTTHNEKGDISYVAGELNFVAEGSGESEGKVVNVSMSVSDYNTETNKTSQEHPIRRTSQNSVVNYPHNILSTWE